jgi:hypothetical protein
VSSLPQRWQQVTQTTSHVVYVEKHRSFVQMGTSVSFGPMMWLGELEQMLEHLFAPYIPPTGELALPEGWQENHTNGRRMFVESSKGRWISIGGIEDVVCSFPLEAETLAALLHCFRYLPNPGSPHH